MPSPTNVVVLYKELAPYFLNCLGEFCRQAGMKATVIAYSSAEEAPFELNASTDIEVISRQSLDKGSIVQLLQEKNPEMVFVGGWFDPLYLQVLSHVSENAVCVIGFDNAWVGSPRQYLACMYARLRILDRFHYAFVPGARQHRFARMMGFKKKNILSGAYSADTDTFFPVFEEKKRLSKIPKRFLYVGRYVKHKGIFDMWKAFQQFHEEHPQWELWCVGTGDQFDARVQADGIRHFGFVQPQELKPLLLQTGVYILPSHFEPWGVSVHEMAASGLPLILSDKVGAGEAFLSDGENGQRFPSRNVDAMRNAMSYIAGKSDSERMEMAEVSHRMAKKITPQIWAKTLMSTL